jgi:undecaprenyl-diphosphatase
VLAHEHFLLYVAVFAVVLLGYAFIELAGELNETESSTLDTKLLLALRENGAANDPIGPPWFEKAWRDVTALGSGTLIVLATLAVVGYLLIVRMWRSASVVVLAVLGAGLLTELLKSAFARPRPDIALRIIEVSSPSFPSGHSLLAAVAYPTLGALLAGFVRSFRVKLYILVCALVAAALVGFSRVYLGVHYPSDVAAGWAVGLGWALVCWIVLRLLQETGVLGRPGPGEPSRGSDPRDLGAAKPNALPRETHRGPRIRAPS